MKCKRLTSLVLAAATAVTLVTAPVSALTMTDISTHWAKDDIEYLVANNLANGYDDSTFRPENKMTACEALLFCSRATSLDSATKSKIATAWDTQLKQILPSDFYSWAKEEMAVCLETGILSVSELQALVSSGALSKTITRENTVLYITRAMQLDALAESLSSIELSFSDKAAITPSMQCYVALLNSYNIIKGDTSNRFLPGESLSRGEMATILRRALDFMGEYGIVVELPEYTTYSWVSGTITDVESGDDGTEVTLKSSLTGTRTVTVPESATVYEYNMEASTTALVVGQYARMNYTSSGTVSSVRLGGELLEYSGTVTAVDSRSITVSTSGGSKVYAITRFTEVKAGSAVGNYSVIDTTGNYSDAVCKVDELGNLVVLEISGGTTRVEGLLTSVTNTSSGQTIQVRDETGANIRYTIPSDATVTVNGSSGTLSTSYKGKYVTVRISADTGAVTSVAVDSTTTYVQGTLKSSTTSKTPYTITVADLSDDTTTKYTLNTAASVTYEGTSYALKNVKVGSFVTARLSGNEIIQLDAYNGSAETTGTITAIQYGTTTKIDVTRADGSIVTFALDMEDLPSIYRDSKTSSIDKLRTGDEVVVTLYYNQVDEIDVTTQSANLSGTINSITMNSSGVMIEVTLSTGGTETYSISTGVTVTKSDTILTVYSLMPNDKISMVEIGGEIISVEITKAATSSTQISGTVLYTNSSDRSFMLQVTNSYGNESIITVAAIDAQLLTTSGSSFTFSKLAIGDEVQVFGTYSSANSSNFDATMVVRY